MDVVVAGGHGKVGMRLLGLLADRGDRARGLIRDPDHAIELRNVGAESVLCDLEARDDISECVQRADALVFAAGAGPRSGPERKRTVDYGGAVKLIEAAKKTGIERYFRSTRTARHSTSSPGMTPSRTRYAGFDA